VYRKSGYYFAALFGAALVAFWPQYLSRLGEGGISVYVHIHAVIMTMWFGLLIAQPFLLRAGRRELHRRLGQLSYILAPLVVISALLLAHARLPAPGDPDLDAAAPRLYGTIGSVTMFAFAYVLAIYYRKHAALHARFMIGTSIALVDPIVARVTAFYLPPLPDGRLYQLVSYTVILVALAVLMVKERSRPAGRGAFPALLGSTTLVFGLSFVVATTPSWARFAHWVRELPLTGF
jgi:uncharacterized membrane protein YozB (DUF420 family)